MSHLRRALSFGLITAVFVGGALPTLGGELAGVQMSDSRKVGDTTLVLNGLALRKKAIFKVYVAGLYLPAKSKDARKILAEDSPRALEMEFVRSVGKDSLVGAWEDCLSANAPGAGSAIQDGFARLGKWMTDVKSGDRIGFFYDPTSGVSVEVGGRIAGTVEGRSFADTLFSCWIGEVPPSEDFKAGLLGN